MTDRIREQHLGESESVDLSPLRLNFDAVGDIRATFGNEILVPGDKLSSFQPFPGA
ncbi:MAG: hypothetical protein AB2809_13500 [Candidatus Thiodiazotropha sp.]